MSLFKKNKAAESTSGSASADLQPPDEFAERARLAYGSADFVGAVEMYAEAVDKLHTMYVMGDCRYRQPSSADQPILDGLVNAVGASIASDNGNVTRASAEKAKHYLADIDRTLSAAGTDTAIFRSAVEALSAEIR